MDINALLAGLWNVIMFALGWLSEHLQSQEQQLLFAAGMALVVISAYAAWKARRMGPYKLAVFGVKLGFALIMLALGWNNAKQIYAEMTQAFGTPLAGILGVFAAGVLGVEFVQWIVKRKRG